MLTHMSRTMQRAKRMSEFYFDVNAWEKDVEARKRAEKAEEESGTGGKRKRPSRKDLVSVLFFDLFSGFLCLYDIPSKYITNHLSADFRRNGSKNRRSRRRLPRPLGYGIKTTFLRPTSIQFFCVDFGTFNEISVSFSDNNPKLSC